MPTPRSDLCRFRLRRLSPILLALLWSCPSQRGPTPPRLAVARSPEKEVALPPDLHGLDLYDPSGRILVRPGVSARVLARFLVSASTETEAARIAEACDLAILPGEDFARVEVRLPAEHPIERIGVDLVVELPPGLDLRLRTHIGPIDTTAYLARTQELRSLEGDLHVGATEDRLAFESTHGDVEILGGFGEAAGHSVDGDLRILTATRGSRLAFEAMSSDVHLLPDAGSALEIVFDHLGAGLYSNVPLRRETGALPDGWTRERLEVGEAETCCRLTLRLREGKLVIGKD